MPVARAQHVLDHWMLHRRALEQLVGRLPESAAGFRPWEGAMNTVALITHIGGASTRFLRAVDAGGFGAMPASPAPAPTTVVEAAEFLRNTTETGTGLLANLTDPQLDAVLEFGRVPVRQPAYQLLALMIDHEIHHKGQLFVYGRMCGVEPPPMVVRAAQ